MTTPLIERIYQKHISIFHEIDGGGTWIDLSAVRYALRAALRELADAQPGADIVEEHRHLDATVRQIERVVEAHDSAVYADLVAGNISLPTAIDGMIAAADRLRGTVEKLRIELAAAIDERNAADQAVRDVEVWLAQVSPSLSDNVAGDTLTLHQAIAHAHNAAIARQDAELAVLRSTISVYKIEIADQREVLAYTNGMRDRYAAELDALRQQLAQMDADNAKLADELRTLRSWSTTQTAPGKTRTVAEMLDAIAPEDNASWNDAMLSMLDAETADYWHGIAAGRWTWRKLPKSVRLAMVRHVLSFGPEERAMSMGEFDAIKPHWMPGAGSHPITFGVPWSTLSDMRMEIEVTL